MDRIIKYKITTEYEGLPCHQFLMRKGYAARILTELRRDMGLVKINGQPSFSNTRLKSGDTVEIWIRETPVDDSLIPVDMEFEIVYEDQDLIVVNKPHHMPIHPSLNNYTNSLANALAFYYSEEKTPFVFRCVNRLDRDTSGLTIVAKNPLSASLLGTQIRERTMDKSYLAIVSGIMDLSCGTIQLPIGRKDASCIERCIDYEHGEEAITHYKVLETFEAPKPMSLVSLHLDTGRTHQIRVHMKAIGHPLIGDFLYNEEDKTLSRQALHANSIGFIHPITGEPLSFETKLPEDMAEIISKYK